jgi:mannosyltransferase PIG-V
VETSVVESMTRPNADAGGVAAPDGSRRAAAANDQAKVRRFWGGISVPFWISASRIAIGVLFAHLVVVLLPQSRQHLPGGTLNPGTWLGAFERWDSAYYLGIAQHGYPLHATQHTAFFPGYPVLVAVAHGVTLGALSFLQSAMVVSWLAFSAASILLYRLLTKLYGQRIGLIATVLFCWFPASLFYLSPYSEALFALEIVAVLFLIERRRFLAASIVAAAASATSPESVALTIALVVAVLLAKKGVLRALVYGAISGTGLLAYGIFLWVRFGNPFEFISVQKFWMRSEHWPFVGLYRNVLALRHFLSGPGTPFGGAVPTNTNIRWMWLLDDASLVLAAVLFVAMVWMWRYRARSAGVPELSVEPVTSSEGAPIPVSFLIVSFVIVLLAACTTISPYALPTYASSEGEARFVSIVMPLYLSGALLVRRHVALICFAVGGCISLALLFQGMYNLGYWVT